MEEGKDQHDVGILLRRRHNVQVVGLHVGEGALPGLDDGSDETWTGKTLGSVKIRIAYAAPDFSLIL